MEALETPPLQGAHRNTGQGRGFHLAWTDRKIQLDSRLTQVETSCGLTVGLMVELIAPVGVMETNRVTEDVPGSPSRQAGDSFDVGDDWNTGSIRTRSLWTPRRHHAGVDRTRGYHGDETHDGRRSPSRQTEDSFDVGEGLCAGQMDSQGRLTAGRARSLWTHHIARRVGSIRARSIWTL